jgi:methylmalonyl-CoA mutase N-terminal domain/subunit
VPDVEVRNKSDGIKKIDELGMAAAAIEKGFYERLINRGIYDYEREFESGAKVKVGVNKFQAEDEVISIKAFRGKPEEEEKQKMRLADLRRRRNNRAVTQSLRLIAEKAKGDGNLVPPILEALKNYATLGEICDALREVWGGWKAKPSLAM